MCHHWVPEESSQIALRGTSLGLAAAEIVAKQVVMMHLGLCSAPLMLWDKTRQV